MAPLAQEVEQHQRLFHTVGSDHADVLLQEPSYEKQQTLRLQRWEQRRQSLRSKEGDQGGQWKHPLQDGEGHQQARARHHQPDLARAERKDLSRDSLEPGGHIFFLSLREEAGRAGGLIGALSAEQVKKTFERYGFDTAYAISSYWDCFTYCDGSNVN